MTATMQTALHFPLSVQIRGGGKVTFTDQDFKGQGGEGAVLIQGNVAYKLYHNPASMMPLAKITELQAIKNDNVIRPLEIIVNHRGDSVGYTMRAVDGHAVSQVYTQAYRKRNKLEPDDILYLIQQMQNTLANVHTARVLIVDGNEVNFLVDNHHKEVYFIDTDSYQTPSYPATALMETVRDRQCKKNRHGIYQFSELTDWYAFAIVSCSLFLGMHPYKCRFSQTDSISDAASRMNQHMEQNMSVFHSGARIPGAAYPLDSIPPAYRKWYEGLFEHGERSKPPLSLAVTAVIAVPTFKVQSGSHLFEIVEVRQVQGDIITVANLNGQLVTTTTDAIYVGSKHAMTTQAATVVGMTPVQGHLIAGWMQGDHLMLYNLSQNKAVKQAVAAEDVMEADGRIYVRYDNKIMELDWVETAPDSDVIPVAKTVANCLPRATELYDGCAIQNLIGTYWVNLFTKRMEQHFIKLQELNGYRVMDARYEGGVLMVIAEQNGQYDKFIYRFNLAMFTQYDVRKTEGLDTPTINFTVVPPGKVLHMDGDTLELFPAAPNSTAQPKALSDPALKGDARLHHDNTQAMFSRGTKLYRFSMRPAP